MIYKAKRIYKDSIFGRELSYIYRGYEIKIAWDFWNTKWYSVYPLDLHSISFKEIKEKIDEYLENNSKKGDK